MMTPRERWLALFAREKPDRVPTDYWATDEVTERLMRELRCKDLEELYTRLDIDGVTRIEPPRTKIHHPDDPDSDIWGLRRRKMDYGAGSYDEFETHPLANVTSVEEVNAFKWPSADDHDYEAYRAMVCDVPRHRFVRSGEFEPFLLYCAMRGLEQGLMDFLENPDILQAALDHIFQYYYELNQRAFEIGKGVIDIAYLAEDLGGQRELLMSLEDIRRFILPNQKKMADLARSYSIHVFYHTDGDVRSVIPDLLDITGIELLNPIQWRCPSMERRALVRDFGDRLIFHGAMDNQQTLPFGTVEDVQREVMENLSIFAGARWICAPCHNLQPITPTDNIVAMYKTIHECGRL
jgi:uroporphyrinogen decarboxylase